MTGRFALFADCLLAGLLALVFALPVVTAYPALVAACALLREGRGVGPRTYWACLRQVIHSGPVGLVAPPLVVALVALDAIAVAAGVPGARLLGAVLVLATAAMVALGLRVAARWRPGQRWPAVVRSALADLVRDPGGSLLLLLAAGAAVAIATAVPVTALLLPGLLAFAAVTVDSRRPA
jgi:hypothetical protein